MRFHVGFSFRLKSLKKFLIPILIGIASYFGLCFFNLSIVNAMSNYNTYFNYNIDEIDFDDYIFIDDDDTSYTLQNILDMVNSNTTDYKINIMISNYYNSLISSYITSVTFHFIPNSYSTLDYYIYNQRNSSNTSSSYDNYRITNSIPYNNGFRIGINNQYSGKTSTAYTISDLKDCLLNNNCPTPVANNSDFNIFTSTTINNNNSYSVDLWGNTNNNNGASFLFPYKVEVPLVLRQYGSNTNYYYLKSIKVNDNEVSFDTQFPTYCDIYTCNSNPPEPDDDNVNFELISNRILYTYSNFSVNDLNNVRFHYSYGVNDLNQYLDNYNDYYYFYGRINHSNNYYSYEPINCTITKTYDNDSELNYFSLDLNNFSCTSSLSNYDKLFFLYGVNFNDESISKTIKASVITSNVDFIYDYYRGRIYDNFNNLATNFSFVISSQSNNEQYSIVNIKSNNNYVVYSDITNVDSSLNINASGNLFQNCVIGEFCQVEFYNKNLLIYNDESFNSSTITNLGIILNNENFIISFSNNDNYYYYDNSNIIVNNNITYTYNNHIDDSYDISSVFNDLNNYIVGIRGDMYKVHLIMTDIYTSIPPTIRYFFNFFFTLGLIFILYKELRDS